MKTIYTKLKDAIIIEPDIYGDHRGWFYESYSKLKFQQLGINCEFVQDNHSFSLKKGTLRGLHFQLEPKAQAKLVRCTRGSIMDIAVDLRKDSITFKQWISVILTSENKKQLFIPQGFAHGFITLEENTEVEYKVDEYYSFDHDRSITYNDPEIGVDWGDLNPILSDKDRNAPLLRDSDINF